MRRTFGLAPMRHALLLLAAAALAGGCSGVKQDPILALAADEALAEGKQLMADGKFSRARPYLVHAFEVEPNSVTGREALLLSADSYFRDGGSTNYIQAEAKYRDFLNRFPTSDKAPYAQFQIANSLAQRMERPDRDQSSTAKALDAYEQLLALYPTSEYAAEARDKMRLVRDNLAEHEFMVGEFYQRFRMPIAAVGRFEYLLETYPEYGAKDKVLFHLAEAYRTGRRYQEAVDTYARLERQYPDSPYTAGIDPAHVATAERGAAEATAAAEAEAAEAAAATEPDGASDGTGADAPTSRTDDEPEGSPP